MRIVIHAVGRLKTGPERELLDRYIDRAAAVGPRLGWGGVTVREIPESRAAGADARKAEEAVRLIEAIPDRARVVALDEHGDHLSSSEFAGLLTVAREATAPEFAVLIGGADGFGPAALERAARRLAFGRLTLPHQLVRILAAEQIYRAATILSGHPYHRA